MGIDPEELEIRHIKDFLDREKNITFEYAK